jgi:putative endonuclease
MHDFNRDIGTLGETLAEKYIKNQGYIILEKNFRCKIGEIDIIGKDKEHIAFVEVKSRYNDDYGRPAEAVNYYKQRKLYKTAEFYIMKNKLFDFSFRFDVIEIFLKLQSNRYELRLIKDAFQL